MLAGAALLVSLCIEFCAGEHWLMLGDFISRTDALQRNLHVETTNSTTSVDASLLLTLQAPPDHRINCVLAASMNMHGDVDVVDGGLGAEKVSLAYKSLDGRADQLFVAVESHAAEGLLLQMRHSVARGSRISILYDEMRGWKLDDGIRDDRRASSDDRAPIASAVAA